MVKVIDSDWDDSDSTLGFYGPVDDEEDDGLTTDDGETTVLSPVQVEYDSVLSQEDDPSGFQLETYDNVSDSPSGILDLHSNGAESHEPIPHSTQHYTLKSHDEVSDPEEHIPVSQVRSHDDCLETYKSAHNDPLVSLTNALETLDTAMESLNKTIGSHEKMEMLPDDIPESEGGTTPQSHHNTSKSLGASKSLHTIEESPESYNS